jgi:hypothetical protein
MFRFPEHTILYQVASAHVSSVDDDAGENSNISFSCIKCVQKMSSFLRIFRLAPKQNKSGRYRVAELLLKVLCKLTLNKKHARGIND